MNEQIESIKSEKLREFAYKAQTKHKGDFGLTVFGGVNLEEYAKLIIAECSKVAESKEQDVNSEISIGLKIQKTLGVKL